MNLNEDVLNTNRTQSRARLNKTVFHRRNHQFVKPAPPKPRKKTAKSSTTSSSTHINWGAQKNCAHSSTTLNTGSSTRTTTTSGDENQIILALTESRGNAASEVGMAVINLNRPSMILCQLSDTQSYVNTLTKINILNPTEIIVPTTFIEGRFQSRLLEKIQQQFSHLKITGFARSAFNKANGIDQIRNLCLPQFNSVLLTLQHKYYCLSAASALLLYIENLRNVYYASESVKVVYEESEGSMIIDISAADKLELVTNERIIDPGQKSSLLAVINKCVTRVGNRALRAMVLQPPCSVPDIEARLDCVTELQKKPQTLAAIQAILMKLNNVDQILSLATLLPDSLNNYSERQLNYILLLNLTLDQIAPLKEIFEETEQQFFLELHETLSSPRFASLKQHIVKTIQEDAYPAKGSNATMQRCFSIKPGINSLLDAVRKTYSELLDEMRAYVETLEEKYGLPLTLSNNNKKGFHMVMALTPQQKRTLKKSDLPEEFTQICRLSGSFTMKTEVLTTYSVRIEDITANILQISNGIIRDLLMKIRDYLDIFYKLIEDIAKLDVLQSLAEASSGNGYVRPKFADYIDIANAKHPMLDMLCSKEPVANPIQANSDYNMHIITGPNGSGKSIYIRQVALIQIMAQVGSYVPATSATLRVCDRLFTRISLDDNMECNISTFELELLEIKNFLTTMTKNSLVIIDELCRSTAVEEGTALAMAICEKMLKTPAYIFLTTHYTTITKLQELYCNVKVWQMEANVTGTDVTNTQLNLKYNLIPGCTTLKRYSIYLIAKMWPQNIVKYIESILDDLSRTQAPQTVTTEGVSEKNKLIYEVKAEIESLKRKNQLTKAAINTILNKYQRQLQEFGVRIVHEGEMSECEKETISATQVTYDYVPDGTDESSSGTYERMYKSVDNLNYLIPDVSLREQSGNCSLMSESSEFVVAPDGVKSFELTPNQSLVDSQRISQVSSLANIFTPMEHTNISNRFFDAAQSPSFGDPGCSKHLTPEEDFSFAKKSQSFFIANKPSSFIHQDLHANRSNEQLSFFVSDETLYPTPEFTNDVQQNSSTEFFENAPPSSKNLAIRNASFSSLNQSTFNVGLSGKNIRTSTPLNVGQQMGEGADEASVLSSVNRTKFTAGLKQTSTPMKKPTNAMFGLVFERKEKSSNPTETSSSNTRAHKSVHQTPETKKVKKSAFDLSDKSLQSASCPESSENNRRLLTNSSTPSTDQAKVTSAPSSRESRPSTSTIGNTSKSSTDSSVFSKRLPQVEVEPSIQENFHEVPSITQTKILEKENKTDINPSTSSFAQSSAKKLKNETSISSMKPTTSYQDGKQRSIAEKSEENSSSNQAKPASFSRVKNVSTPFAKRQKRTCPPATFFGNTESMDVDFEERSKLDNKNVHKLRENRERANASSSLFENSKSVEEFEGYQKASGSSTSQKKLNVTPLQRGTNASTSCFGTSKAFGQSKDVHEASNSTANQMKLQSTASGILEPMVIDAEEHSMLNNKNVHKGPQNEERADASTSLFGNSKSAEELEGFQKALGSCTKQEKLKVTSLQTRTNASTSSNFNQASASGISEPMQADFEERSMLAKRSLDKGPASIVNQAKVTTPVRADASISLFGDSSQSRLNVSPLQRKTSASTSFFETSNMVVVDFAEKSKDVHEASNSPAHPTPLQYFKEKSISSKRSLVEGPVSSRAKVTTPLLGNFKSAEDFCKASNRPNLLQRATSTSKEVVADFAGKSKDVHEASNSPANQTKSQASPLRSFDERSMSEKRSQVSSRAKITTPLFGNSAEDFCEASSQQQRATSTSTSYFDTSEAFAQEVVLPAFGNFEPIMVDFGKMSTLTNKSLQKAFLANPLETGVGASTSFFKNSKLAERPKSFQDAKSTTFAQRKPTSFSEKPQLCSKWSEFLQEAPRPSPISLEKSIAHASTSYLEEERSFGAFYTPKRTSSSFYCTPNEISSTSLDSTKFLAGLTKTSTPLNQNKEPTSDFERSISYSPLCPSPTKPTPSTSTTQKPKKRLGVRYNKFIPPNKLTKRQIEEDFAEQTRKMMESGDSSKVSDYARRICNRPTVRQLQQSEHIASIKRTEDGVVVIPVTEQKKRERKRVLSFNAPYKVFSPNLLSDANEEKFMEFLERGKKNTNVEVEQKTEIDASSCSSKYVSFTPDGYYKEHKVEIKRIVNKYLQSEEEEKENSAHNTTDDLFE